MKTPLSFRCYFRSGISRRLNVKSFDDWSGIIDTETQIKFVLSIAGSLIVSDRSATFAHERAWRETRDGIQPLSRATAKIQFRWDALYSRRPDTIGLGNEIFYFPSRAPYEAGFVEFSRIAIQIDPIILHYGPLRLRNLAIPLFRELVPF